MHAEIVYTGTISKFQYKFITKIVIDIFVNHSLWCNFNHSLHCPIFPIWRSQKAQLFFPYVLCTQIYGHCQYEKYKISPPFSFSPLSIFIRKLIWLLIDFSRKTSSHLQWIRNWGQTKIKLFYKFYFQIWKLWGDNYSRTRLAKPGHCAVDRCHRLMIRWKKFSGVRCRVNLKWNIPVCTYIKLFDWKTSILR